jgi:hypothetical protein
MAHIGVRTLGNIDPKSVLVTDIKNNPFVYKGNKKNRYWAHLALSDTNRIMFAITSGSCKFGISNDGAQKFGSMKIRMNPSEEDQIREIEKNISEQLFPRRAEFNDNKITTCTHMETFMNNICVSGMDPGKPKMDEKGNPVMDEHQKVQTWPDELKVKVPMKTERGELKATCKITDQCGNVIDYVKVKNSKLQQVIVELERCHVYMSTIRFNYVVKKIVVEVPEEYDIIEENVALPAAVQPDPQAKPKVNLEKRQAPAKTQPPKKKVNAK